MGFVDGLTQNRGAAVLPRLGNLIRHIGHVEPSRVQRIPGVLAHG